MNMQNMMKQVQKMQQDMMKEQEALQQKEFTKEAPGKVLTVTATGDKKITALTLNEEVLNPEDKEMIEDVLLTTLNELFSEIDSETERVMGRFTRGMNLPF